MKFKLATLSCFILSAPSVWATTRMFPEIHYERSIDENWARYAAQLRSGTKSTTFECMSLVNSSAKRSMTQSTQVVRVDKLPDDLRLAVDALLASRKSESVAFVYKELTGSTDMDRPHLRQGTVC